MLGGWICQIYGAFVQMAVIAKNMLLFCVLLEQSVSVNAYIAVAS
jgi:hypothetical protein